MKPLLCKCLIIGDSGVGKSSIMRQYTVDDVHTIGVDYESKIVDVATDCKSLEKVKSSPLHGTTRRKSNSSSIKTTEISTGSVKLQIWDTAGQERFAHVIRSYYRNAQVVFLVYDKTDIDSFYHVEKWLKEVKAHCIENIIVYLIGNKTDLESLCQVPTTQGKEFATLNNLHFIETSAKTGDKIETMFCDAATRIYQKGPIVTETSRVIQLNKSVRVWDDCKC